MAFGCNHRRLVGAVRHGLIPICLAAAMAACSNESEEVEIVPGGRAPRAESYYGDDPLVTGEIPSAGKGEGFELNFENAPVTTA